MLEFLNNKPLLRNLVLYGVIGCIAAVFDTLIFYVLCFVLSVVWELSNCISMLCGMCISFLLNRRYNFKVMDHAVRRGLIFFGIGMCGLMLSQLLLWFASSAGINLMLAKIVSVVIVALFQFTLNRAISFGLDFGDKGAKH